MKIMFDFKDNYNFVKKRWKCDKLNFSGGGGGAPAHVAGEDAHPVGPPAQEDLHPLPAQETRLRQQAYW